MSKRIKGITIEINAETKGLDKALQDVNKSSRDINKELRDINNLIKFNPKDTELLAQKKKLLGDQVSTTKEKLDRLKEAEAQVQKQFENGDIGEEQYRAFQREVVETESKLKHYENQLKQISSSHLILSQNLQDVGKKMQDVGKKMSDVGGDLTKKLTVPLVAIGGVAFKAAMDFESAFAGVEKVVDGTTEEIAGLEKGIREMSKVMPQSAVEIAGVAEEAGKLGIETKNILGFTETMVMMGDATDLSSAQAAESLAQLANITGMSQNDFGRLGSSIVSLGNNFATTEPRIVEMGLRLAGTASQVGMSEHEMMALATAMSSVGIEAQAGGGSMSRVMQKMNTEVLSSGKKLNDFARVAGMTAEDFAQKWKKDPSDAILQFVKGLDEIKQGGGDVTTALKDLGITSTQEIDTMMRLSGANETLAEALGVSADGWEENTALAEEAQVRYDTAESKIQIAKNTLTDLAITIGATLSPIIVEIAEKVAELTNKFSNLSPETQKNILVIAGVAAAIGPVLLIMGKLITVVGTIAATIGKLIPIVKGLGVAITVLTGPIGLVIAAIAALGIGAIVLGKHMSQDALPEVERFGEGVSETTQEAVGSFMDMTEEANKSLKELSWGQQEVTAEMAEDMRVKQEEITNTLLTAMSERHQEEIAATQEQMANLDMLSEEQKANILEKTNQRFEEEKTLTEEGHARINEIMQNAADEGRAITQEESDEILKIREGMTEQAVKVMSENEVEQKLILEKMKSNAETISAQEAAEVVRNATQKKDDVIKEANDQYDETYKWAIRQRDELGTLSDEEAADVIAAAELQRDESVAAAEEKHRDIVKEAKAQAGEHVNEVDWETGEVLSKWEVLKRDTSTKFKQMKDDAVQKAEDMAKDAKSSFEDLRKSAGEKFGDAAITIRDKMDDARERVGEKIDAIKGFFSDLKLKLPTVETDPVEAARKFVSEKIEAIKKFFSDLKLKLPTIDMPKMPKFTVTGKFGLNPITVPKLGIKWNKEGAIFTRPTIFDTMQGLQGVGERGAEAVLPISKLSGILADTLDKAGYGKANQPNSKMDRQIVQNITIESPTPLTPSEVARQTKNATRALAMEW